MMKSTFHLRGFRQVEEGDWMDAYDPDWMTDRDGSFAMCETNTGQSRRSPPQDARACAPPPAVLWCVASGIALVCFVAAELALGPKEKERREKAEAETAKRSEDEAKRTELAKDWCKEGATAALADVEAHLLSTGKQKFLLPVYRALAKAQPRCVYDELAARTFARSRESLDGLVARKVRRVTSEPMSPGPATGSPASAKRPPLPTVTRVLPSGPQPPGSASG